MRRLPMRLVVLLLLPLLPLLGGCYFCPYGDFDLGAQQFYSWKMGDATPAKQWVPISLITLQQPVEITGGTLSLNAVMTERVVKGKAKLRWTVKNSEGAQRTRKVVSVKFNNKGELTKVPEMKLGDERYEVGDELCLEVWTGKSWPEGLALLFQFNLSQERESVDIGAG